MVQDRPFIIVIDNFGERKKEKESISTKGAASFSFLSFRSRSVLGEDGTLDSMLQEISFRELLKVTLLFFLRLGKRTFKRGH